MKINFIHHRIFFNLTTNTNDNENAGAIVDIFKNSKSFFTISCNQYDRRLVYVRCRLCIDHCIVHIERTLFTTVRILCEMEF